MTLDVTVIAWAMLGIALYYLGLLILSNRQHAAQGRDLQPWIILIIPAHNEEMVIAHTIERLASSTYERKLVVVMNDGSTDRTASVAREAGKGRAVRVIDRAPDVAGRGKGAVLNHAFALIMAGEFGPEVSADDPAQIIVGVMDADGQLDPDALDAIAPYFADPRVGAVQIGVRIVNARDGILQRAQDIEFVGFSGFVQTARDRLGSVGLGGNGQFTRLSALMGTGSEPWSSCLTEDLDLGLTLVEHGWRVRFCPDVFVAQQGLDHIRPLLRQRTRWVQGHYQCWRHYPRLLSAPDVPWWTKLDLSLYLGLLVMVVVFTANAAISAAQVTGLVHVRDGLLSAIPSDLGQRVMVEVVSLGPPLCFVSAYQRRAKDPLPWWAVPAATVYFTAYTYLFAVCQVWAWTRMVLGKGNWAKTQRVLTHASVTPRQPGGEAM